MNYSSLGKNAFFYAVGTAGIRTASFLLIPIYAYSMPVADYGLLSILLQTAQIMVIVVSMGSRTALVRFAKEHEDKNNSGCLIGTTIFINALGAVAVAGVAAFPLLPIFRNVLHTQNALHYVLLTWAAASFNCLAFHLMAYYRAGLKGLKVTIANLAAAFSMILLTMVFLRVFRLGIEGALLAQVIIYALLSAFLLAAIFRKMTLSISFPLTWKLIRFGLPLILVMSGGLITQATAFYFLSYSAGLDQVGVYSLGLKMAQIVEMVLILPFEMAYEPFVYGHAGDPQLWPAISRLLTYVIAAFVFIACGVAFVTRDALALIAPPAFGSAYPVIFLVIPALAFRIVYYVGESLLFLESRTEVVGTVVTAFTLLGVALNYLFIARWGMYGAAAAFVVTTAGTGVTVMKLGLRRAPVTIEKDRLLMAAMFLFGFLFIIYAARTMNAYVYYTTVPAMICAAIASLYASKFVREDERRVIESLKYFRYGSAGDNSDRHRVIHSDQACR